MKRELDSFCVAWHVRVEWQRRHLRKRGKNRLHPLLLMERELKNQDQHTENKMIAEHCWQAAPSKWSFFSIQSDLMLCRRQAFRCAHKYSHCQHAEEFSWMFQLRNCLVKRTYSIKVWLFWMASVPRMITVWIVLNTCTVVLLHFWSKEQMECLQTAFD